MTPDPVTPLTADSARSLTEFSLYRKTARTLISDQTFPPGTTFQTPEGLRAEDEETRAALDVQGGIYPIRESVFRATYTLDAARQTPGAEAGLRERIDDIDGAATDYINAVLAYLDPENQYTESRRRAMNEASGDLAASIFRARTALQAAPVPILDATNATERERIAYGRGLNGKAIDGSHIPGSEAER